MDQNSKEKEQWKKYIVFNPSETLVSPPVAILDMLHGPVQCPTIIPLTRTVLLVDSRKIFDRKDKIAVYENMTLKITLLQYIVFLFTL